MSFKDADKRGAGEMIPYVPTAAGDSMLAMSDTEFNRMKGIATMFAQASVFKDADAAPVAFAKMVIGRELGLGLGQSMLGLHLVKGGVMMHYSTLLASVRARGWNYRIPTHTEEKCVIEWVNPEGEVAGVTEYTIEEANKAGLTKPGRSGEPSMYDKVPKNMLLARAVSNGVKAYVPEAMGGMPIYVQGELPERSDLSEGVGTGEARVVELPPEVLAVAGRAEELGHVGWASLTAWEARVDRGPEATAAAIAEAQEELDELENQPPPVPAEPPIVGDVPIDTQGLPEVPEAEVVAESPQDPEYDPGPKKKKAPPEAPPAPSVDTGKLRRQMKAALDRQKEAEPESTEWFQLQVEIEWCEEELQNAAEKESDANPQQETLM